MIKFRMQYDKDKETEWINKYAQEGYAMTGFFAGFYKFEKCDPGKYIYQIDFCDSFGTVSNDYRDFMNENGIEIVQCWGPWVILRKLASEGEFVLYSDTESQIEHYKKILKMFKIAGAFEGVCAAIEIVIALVENKPMFLALGFLLLAFFACILRTVFNTKSTIRELKERQTGIEEPVDNRNMSPFLAFGLLLNSCALISTNAAPYFIKLILQISAIALMLVGIVQTVSNMKKTDENK